MTDADDRHNRGAKTLEAIHGERGARYAAELAKFSPDFAAMLVDFAYGDVYARPGLDPRARQIATIAALTVLANSERELTIHIGSALRAGCTRTEVLEVIMQMAVYAGFPAALAGLEAARNAFAADDNAPAKI